MHATRVVRLEEVVSAIQDSCGSDDETVAALNDMICSGRLLFRRSGHARVMPCVRHSGIVWPPPIASHAAVRSH